MNRLSRIVNSSIGKKVRMALTGLLLCGFLVTHLGGNLFLYKGSDSFNHYAKALEDNPLLPAAEIGLFVLFLLHIVTAIQVRYENKRARPVSYAHGASAGGSSWGSATMIFSGLLLLAFLFVHVKSFRFAADRGDLYQLVMTAFQSRRYALFYAAAMAALGLHLSHGFWSGFQTLGASHPKYTPMLRAAGWVFAVVVSAGFASIPIWACFLRQ